MAETVVIDKRFCGPKASANGGYASGVIAAFVDGPARVTLKAPPPLGAPIAIARENGKVVASAGGTIVGVAEPADVSIDLPRIPDNEEIAAAREAFLAHPQSRIFPYCFVCGPKRATRDGLRIFSGEVKGSPVNADCWTPTDDLATKDGLVASEYLWSALDCPSAFALRRSGGLTLLGRFAAEIRRRPKPGERLIAMAWMTGEDGRKQFSDSALVDEDGETIAAANAVWIEVADPAFLKKLRSENE